MSYLSFEDPRQGYWAKSTLKKMYPKKKEDIEEWYQQNEKLSVNQPARQRFNRRQTLSSKLHQFQIDLMDITVFKEENDGHTFLLTRIDVLSRFADAIPLKDKTAKEVVRGLEVLFDRQMPRKVSSDRGKEFENKDVRELMERHRIYQFFLNPPMKGALIERFHRTLWGLINRFQLVRNSYRFIDYLPDLIYNYNNKVHSTIKMKPNQVNEQNAKDLYLRLSKKTREGMETKKKAIFEEGDMVRVQTEKKPFTKETTARWSREVFTVDKVLDTFPWTYRLVDWEMEEVLGSFYDQDLQLVKYEPTEFDVEEILDERYVGRGRNRKKELLVSYKGWGPKFNSWEPEENVRII